MRGRKFTEKEGERLTRAKAHVIVFAILALGIIAVGVCIP